jgi:hypothetical protein
LNRKDIEDFLLFPTDIHMPSYDQWFKRYALSNLKSAAEILRWTDLEEAAYFDFLTNIGNEKSRNSEYKTCRHLPQISNKYLCVLC